MVCCLCSALGILPTTTPNPVFNYLEILSEQSCSAQYTRPAIQVAAILSGLEGENGLCEREE